MPLDQHGLCPKCGANWDAGDILEKFEKLRDAGDSYYAIKTNEELVEIAGSYGWTPETPKRFTRLIGIEFPRLYDGVWEYACPDCDARFPRFQERRNVKV